MKNRVICFMMSLAFLFPVIPGTAQAAEGEQSIYGWKINVKDNAACNISTDYFCAGTNSLSMTVSENSSSAQVSTDVAVEQGKTYTISFYARSEEASSFSCTMGTAKYGLVSLMKKYNWTWFSYTYTHTGENISVPLVFELSNKGQVYIDDVCVREDKTLLSRNKIRNSGFELTGPEEDEENAPAVMDIEKAFGSFEDKTAMPLLFADNIIIDGDGSDWIGYTGANVPSENSSVSTITDYQGSKDLSSKFRAAYDDEYLYIYGEVTDDKHVQSADGSGYWREDSIQVVLSTAEEDYGIEMGFYLLESGESKYYCSELEKTEWGVVDPKVVALREKMQFKATRSDDKTTYEVAIPWNIKFEERPDSFLLDVLIDDNDGSGRKGYAEWKEGIGKTKSNEEFVAVYPIPQGYTVFGYLDGAKSVYEYETKDYSLYLCNTNDKETDVRVGDSADTIKIPAKSVYRTYVSMTADTVGTQLIEVPLKADQVYVVRKSVPVKRNLEIAFAAFRESELEELKMLAQQCNDQGISTDYEDISITTIENFIDYGMEDKNGGRESRASYVYDCLEELYTDVKEKLTSYLNHEKTPNETDYYNSSEVNIENQAFYTQTLNSKTGEVSYRPVFFSGYLDNKRESKEISALGSNMLQFELLMSGYIGKPDSIRGWSINRQGDAKGTYTYDKTAYNGDYSLKISNETALSSNVYCNLVQKVPVEAGKTYQISFYAKAEGANGCSFRPNGWKTSKISISGTYDWNKITHEYTPDEDGEIEFMFMVEDVTNALYLDNIRIVEKGTKNNLIRHGSFEEQPVVINGYSVNVDRLQTEVIPALDEALANNVGVDLLMSVHYFPTTIMAEEEYSSGQSGFIKYDIFKEEPKAVVEAFFKGLVPLVADHPALRSICISNEPTYRVGRDAGNAPAWHQYLSEIYSGDVSAMNTNYHESFAAFDDVPLQETYENMAIYYDYLRFNDKMFADWHKWLANMVKEIAPEVRVHAKMMSVINQTDTTGTEQAIARGTNPELFAEFSDLNGNDAWNFIGSSRTMLVKNLWYDLLTSIKNVPVFNSEDHVIEDRDERYNEKYAPHIATDLWQGAIHGRSASTQWKWERSLSTTSSASGNIKHRPDAVALAGQTMLDLNRLAEEVVELQNVEREIGIFYSYPSRVHCITHSNGVYKAYETVSYNGKRSKIITESMLEGNKLDNIKLLLIPNVTNTTVEAVEAVKRFIEQGGKVILIGECFKNNQYGNPLQNQQSVEYILSNSLYIPANSDETGTKLVAEESLNEAVSTALKSMGLQDIELIDVKTGLPVSDVEWSYASDENGILLNLCLYDWDQGRSISVKKNGIVCSGLTELRSGERLPDQFEVQGYTPMLIRIN